MHGLDGVIEVPSLSIDTEGTSIFQRPYQAPLTKYQVIDDAVDRVIGHSNSAWPSPVTLALKKGGVQPAIIDTQPDYLSPVPYTGYFRYCGQW